MPKGVVRDGYVKMVDEYGAPVEVPLASIQDAYAAGWQPEAPEAIRKRELQREHGTAGQQALTFAESTASGLTFGISDQALVAALGEEYREDASQRREANPGTALAGEITGAVAPALMSGGSSLAAKAVTAPGRALLKGGAALERAAGNSLAGKVVGGAASGALEGAAFSAGRASADAALGGTELTAEKLMSAGAEGALWGGVGGAVFGGAAYGAKKAGDYVSDAMLDGRTMRQALDDYVGGQQLKRVVGDAPMPNLTPERARKLGQKLLEEGADTLPAVKAAAAKADETAVRVSRIANDLGVKPDVKKVFAKVDEAAEKIRQTPTAEAQKLAKRLDREIAPLRKAVSEGREYTVSDLTKLRSELKPGKPEVDHVRQALDEAVDEAFDQVDDEALHALAAKDPEVKAALADKRNAKDAWRQAQANADDWRQLARLAEAKPSAETTSLLKQIGKDTALGLLTGVVTGDVSTGAVVGALAGKARGAAWQAVRDFAVRRGAGTIHRMASQAAKVDGRLDGAAQTLLTGADRAGSAVTEGNVGGLLSAAAVRALKSDIKAAEAGETLVGAEVVESQPEVALSMQQIRRADAQYIKARVPATHSPKNLLQPHLEPDQDAPMSSVELSALTSVVSALNDPASVAEDLARGKYDPIAVQALKDRRPEVWGKFRSRVFAYAAMKGDAIPFAQRNLLGQAFDLPLDWSLQPENMAAIQAVTSAPEQGSPPASQGANISESIASSYALPSNPIGT